MNEDVSSITKWAGYTTITILGGTAVISLGYGWKALRDTTHNTEVTSNEEFITEEEVSVERYTIFSASFK